MNCECYHLNHDIVETRFAEHIFALDAKKPAPVKMAFDEGIKYEETFPRVFLSI